MCTAMGRPALFQDTFENNRPKNFSFLVRPTQKEFNDFVLTLDKMMSDNIDKEFFKYEVEYETEERRHDGKLLVRQKGTIAILEDWLAVIFRPSDPRPMEDMIATFKQVRRQRQKPAHALEADVFDPKFFHQQRKLVILAYKAIRTLRLIFTNHPAVKGAEIEIPDVLNEGRIWTQ